MNRREATKKTLVLSDIYQSGTAPEALYTQVSELAVKRGIDKFIGIGPELSAQADKIQIADKAFFADVPHFLSSEAFTGLRNELILLKGARNFGFDQITELLEQKVHETILEVNLNAVVDNLNYFRSFLKPDTKMVCMIKADAYGAGAIEIAKTLQDQRVDYLAVAVADEGVTLRKAGITSNIMIMNPEMTAFKTMFDYDLEPEVYSFRLLDALIKAARKEGITGWPVHIKFDTGMHRLGFDPVDDIYKLVDRLKHQTAIIPARYSAISWGPTATASTTSLPSSLHSSRRAVRNCRLPSVTASCAIWTTLQASSTSQSARWICVVWVSASMV